MCPNRGTPAVKAFEMSHTLARSIAVGIFAAGVILGAFLPPILRSRRCIAVNGPT
jgi:hypothetical protein